MFTLYLQAKIEENIYLGPYGAPPSQSKQQEPTSSTRKQRFKQKLKEADQKVKGTGRENKLENLRELVGGGKVSNMAKGTGRDWLDPHCHESQFEKRYPQWVEHLYPISWWGLTFSETYILAVYLDIKYSVWPFAIIIFSQKLW